MRRLFLFAFLLSAPHAFAETVEVPCVRDLQTGKVAVEPQFVKDTPNYKILRYAPVTAEGSTVSEGKCVIELAPAP